MSRKFKFKKKTTLCFVCGSYFEGQVYRDQIERLGHKLNVTVCKLCYSDSVKKQ